MTARISLLRAIMSRLRTFLMAASLIVLVAGASSSAIAPVPSAAMKTAATHRELSLAADRPASAVARDARQANVLLGALKSKYHNLGGVTVSVGTTPQGEQAVAYYTEGRIVISRNHTVGLDRILNHEIWHVIDWRDNGRLDWAENLPPRNASDYAKK